jgi:aspartokinase
MVVFMDEDRLIIEFFFEKPSFEEVSKIATALEEAGIKSILLPPEERDINTHLVVETSDLDKTKVRLVEMGIPFKEKERVLIKMMNKPGAMAETVQKISSTGINLIYAFSVAMGPEMSYLILGAADNEAVLKIIKS